MLCAGITTYAALRRSEAKSGQWVVVSGAGGGLGHIAVQLSARSMAHRVIGIDDGVKEALVRECGAEHFIDINKHNDKSIVEEVKRFTDGIGAHAAIVCNTSNKAYAQAIEFLGVGGALVCVGVPGRLSCYPYQYDYLLRQLIPILTRYSFIQKAKSFRSQQLHLQN